MEEHNKTAEKGKEIEREAGKSYNESDRRERRFFRIAFAVVFTAIALWVFIGLKVL